MPRKFSSATSFNDLLFNILLGFVFLFLMALVIINPKKKNNEESPVDIKTSILITLEWPDNSASDVDLFLELPNKKRIFYGNKQHAIASLDRDDTGHRSDRVQMPDGSTKLIHENWEHIFINNPIPGWYTVNVLMYSMQDPAPIPVKVKVEKFKPASIIYHGTELLGRRQQQTRIRFKLDANGKVQEINNDYKSLVGGATQ